MSNDEEAVVVCVDWGKHYVESEQFTCDDCTKPIAVSTESLPHYPPHARYLCLECALRLNGVDEDAIGAFIRLANKAQSDVQKNVQAWGIEEEDESESWVDDE